jgi:hypothetical protein
MANVVLQPTPVDRVFTDECLRTIIVILIAYWGLLALALPISNVDAHIYNLARLAVAEKNGFWQTTAWNSSKQVVFPWTFDAVHYPFLKIGYGTALPSFFSFLGLVVILFSLVSQRWGANVGYWSVLALLAMPMIMLQATTTKNDLVIAFGVACWLYSLVRFQRSQSTFFIFASALSLAFTAGSKTYAVAICGILTFITAWIWRKNARTLVMFFGFYLVCIFLFSSIETYVLSWKIYQSPLGPVMFVGLQKNHDGLRGLAANFIRYYLANISFGIDGNGIQSGLAKFLESACPRILHKFHLYNVGYTSWPRFNDKTLQFTKAGSEYFADFGLIGFVALLTSSVYVWRPALRNPCWILAASGFAALALISYMVGWMPWNQRFLCLSFALFGIAMATIIFGELKGLFFLKRFFGVLIIWSAFAQPFLCVDRTPVDVGRALYARKDFTFDERSEVRQVYDDVIALRRQEKGTWVLVAGEDSVVLPFLELKEEALILTPQWEQISKFQEPKKGPLFVLVINREIPANFPAQIEKQYAGNTYILRLR